MDLIGFNDANTITDYSHIVGRAVFAGAGVTMPNGKNHVARYYLGSDVDHYLVRDTNDLYWHDGSTYTKLNGGVTGPTGPGGSVT